MSQYQTFPGCPGDSDSLGKLKALKLPDLREKKVLDLGCNTGFFTGYAAFSGAATSTGIDFDRPSIGKAKKTVPKL